MHERLLKRRPMSWLQGAEPALGSISRTFLNSKGRDNQISLIILLTTCFNNDPSKTHELLRNLLSIDFKRAPVAIKRYP